MTTKQDGRSDLLAILEGRFSSHAGRHPELDWMEVLARISASPQKLASLRAMEGTGGEPDVVGRDAETGEFLFVDCSAESPAGRRSLCYDDEALAARKEHKPAGSAEGTAASMGVELLDEEGYRALQKLGSFDLKTSSWIRTPADIRKRGGAMFCDRRYDHVFTYHNGADSYYAARGFRALVRI